MRRVVAARRADSAWVAEVGSRAVMVVRTWKARARRRGARAVSRMDSASARAAAWVRKVSDATRAGRSSRGIWWRSATSVMVRPGSSRSARS